MRRPNGPESGAGGTRSDTPWPRLEEMFFEICDLPPDRLAERLDELCGDDDTLRRELEGLLRADHGDHALLDEPEDALGPLAERALEDPLLGARLGAYQLTRRLGAGGMSTVYLAQRVDGAFEGKCAVKVVRRGIDTERVIARFGRERQILSQLRHPAITRLLDGGQAPDGRPYLVMEFVDGISIDRYCRDNDLPVEQILELAIRICNAVEHAHRRLVVHRDIKPANILVTPDGSPRLLDFGVARLLDASSDGELATTVGARFLTPEYASPEQIDGAPITTAIDVFSLGVLLYELLSGHHPFARDGLSRVETARAIRDVEPAPPSRRAGGRRGARLRGDLDALVLRAMSKDPEARYPSVGELAADLRNVLQSRPVTARRGRNLYRARRWLRRHRLLAGTALGLGALAALGVHRIAEERDRAQAERLRVERVKNSLIEVLQIPDPIQRQGVPALSAEALAEQAASLLDRNLQEDPDLRADFLLAAGRAVRNLGDGRRAHDLFETALEATRELEGAPGLRAEALSRLAETAIGIDRFAEARTHLDELAALVEEERGGAHWERRILGLEATLLDATGDSGRAAEKLQQALVALDFETEPKQASWLLDLYARLDGIQTPRQAVDKAGQSLELANRAFGTSHPISMDRRETLALARWRAGDVETARGELLEVLDFRRRTFGAHHPSLASANHHLGALERSVDRLAEAQDWLQKALAVAEDSLGKESLHWAESAFLLADVRRRQGLYEEAVNLVEDAFPLLARRLGPTHVETYGASAIRLESLVALARYDEAEPLFSRTLQAETNADRPLTWRRADLFRLGGAIALGRGDRVLAAERFGRAEALGAELSEAARQIFSIRLGLVRAHLALLQGRGDEAEALLRQARADSAEVDPERRTYFLRTEIAWAEWLWLKGEPTAALEAAGVVGQRALELFGPATPAYLRAQVVEAAISGGDLESALERLPAGERSPYLALALGSSS